MENYDKIVATIKEIEKKTLFVKELGELWARYSIHMVEKMEYLDAGKLYRNEVLVYFKGGSKLRVNVALDSPEAMLSDILKFIHIVGNVDGIEYE